MVTQGIVIVSVLNKLKCYFGSNISPNLQLKPIKMSF